MVTRDKKIRTRPEERRAIVEHNVGCFILAQKQALNRWNQLKIVVQTLDNMTRRFDETPKPVIFTIDSALRFRRYM